MITRIRGKLESVAESSVVLAPGIGGGEGAIAVEVAVPAYLIESLTARVGEQIELWTKLVLESSNQGASFAPRLTGFVRPEDRAFFEKLTSVKGLGGRRALRAMAAEPSAIAGAILSADVAALQKLPEIGKKLAQTLVHELADQVAAFIDPGVVDPDRAGAGPGAVPGFAAAEQSPRSVAEEDAVAALVALGQAPADAQRRVRLAADAVADGEAATADELVAAAFGA